MGYPAVIDWVGWEREGWYIGYPDVFPPKEGSASFEQAVQQTHASGNRVMMILNAASYSAILPEWETFKSFAATGEDGSFLNA